VHRRWMIAGLLFCAGQLPAEPVTVAAQEVTVEDADTLSVLIDGETVRLQLAGIDAPEDVQNPKLQRDLERTGMPADQLLALGVAASEGARSLLPQFAPFLVRYDPEARDRYGRVPGDLIDREGRRFSLRLVEEGLARPLPVDGGAEAADFAAAAAAARAAGRGLWGSHPEAFAAWAGVGVRPGQGRGPRE